MNDLTTFLLPNEPTCIVACSAATARFWKSTTRFGDWKLLTEMRNELAGSRESDFSSDRPGRAFDIAGKGRHAMSPAETGQEHQTLLFARQCAGFLSKAISDGQVTKLVLLAAPRFLGYLRSELSNAARAAIVLAEPRNLSDLDETEIRKYFE
jgi:protein required for attachment to host cells